MTAPADEPPRCVRLYKGLAFPRCPECTGSGGGDTWCFEKPLPACYNIATRDCQEEAIDRSNESGAAYPACVLNDRAVELWARIARCLRRCPVNVQLRLQSACDIPRYAR